MLKLYDREGSGNAYKVRLLLALLDVPYERIPVGIRDGRNDVDAAYLALNPRGQIPTLVDGDDHLWGSTAILAFLAARHDPARTWLPQDPLRLGKTMQWLELAQNEVADGLFRSRMIAHMGRPGDLDAAHAQAAAALCVLEGRLAQADWLTDGGPTVADVACFPYVALAHQGRVDLAPYPGVQRWVARVKALPRFVGMPGV
jgi:glutathione S-transferase